ncbi:hypothetical protein KIS1582_0638 [Cytobacillus firmus]|uniref:Uncharacterized protein n=1 Tax=Cytobacillus firmus TaxID=1399 RepID=A0A800NFA1_CYTFI|nr:hypothetical protein KIS1582_0638 [Cytobacillus firmus]
MLSIDNIAPERPSLTIHTQLPLSRVRFNEKKLSTLLLHSNNILLI